MNKKIVLKMLKEILLGFVAISELMFKATVYLVVCTLVASRSYYLGVDNLFFDVVDIMVLTGGLWWAIKDIVKTGRSSK